VIRSAATSCTLLLACACSWGPASIPEQAKANARFRWDIENSARRAVELWLHQGHILVETAPPGSQLVDVAADVTVHADTRETADRLLAGVNRSRARFTERTISLQLTLPLGASLECIETSYRVVVPAGTDLRIVTQSGRVAMRGYDGKALVQTESGDISARLVGGEVQLESGTGTIRLEGSYSQAKLTSRSGPLQVVLPGLAKEMRIELATECGPMDVESPDGLAGELCYQTTTGKIDAEIPLRVTDVSTTPATREKRFTARFGPADAEPRVFLLVRSDQASFALHSLTGGSW
jgi:hypothetical protein